MADEGEFETTVDLNAPVQEVFRHLTEPAAMIRWMGQHATLEPTAGGAFEVDINGVPVRGRYLEVDPPRRVVVSWGVAGNAVLPPGATEVEFTLTPSSAAPGCAWSTGTSRRIRRPCTAPAGTTSWPGSAWPRPGRIPAAIHGLLLRLLDLGRQRADVGPGLLHPLGGLVTSASSGSRDRK